MKPLNRLFFAFRPPHRERAQIGWVRDQREFATPVANDQLHATLGITEDFQEFPDDLATQMLAIGDAIRAEPVAIMLNQLSANNRSLALRPNRVLRGLDDVVRQIHLPMQSAGILRAHWKFNFHVTLGYRDGRPYSERVDPIGWRNSEFVLIHSLVGRTQHRELCRWPLVPRQLGLFD